MYLFCRKVMYMVAILAVGTTIYSLDRLRVPQVFGVTGPSFLPQKAWQAKKHCPPLPGGVDLTARHPPRWHESPRPSTNRGSVRRSPPGPSELPQRGAAAQSIPRSKNINGCVLESTESNETEGNKHLFQVHCIDTLSISWCSDTASISTCPTCCILTPNLHLLKQPETRIAILHRNLACVPFWNAEVVDAKVQDFLVRYRHLDRGLSSWLDGWWATPGGVQLEKTPQKSLENVIFIIPSISVVSHC